MLFAMLDIIADIYYFSPFIPLRLRCFTHMLMELRHVISLRHDMPRHAAFFAIPRGRVIR